MASFKVLFMFLVSVLLGANATNHTTKYEIGPGRIMRDFTSAGGLSATDYHVVDIPILAPLSATGSATVTSTNAKDGSTGTKYAALCIPNPFRRMGTGTGRTFINAGSGVVRYAVYKNIRNPNGAGGDVGFVSGCESGTGASLMDNLATATGARVRYTTGSAAWNELDYIKVGLRKDPTAGFQATLSVVVSE